MKIAFFGTMEFEPDYFNKANKYKYEITYIKENLSKETAYLAKGHNVVCVFVSDQLDQATLEILNTIGIKLIALRSAGFNNVDLIAAKKLDLPVVRVPQYSPNAVAEHAVALILALNRKICHAYLRVREGNFSLNGLAGFDLNGKTVGLIGTGKIGAVMARIMTGFGCRVLAYDILPDPNLKFCTYVNDVKTLYKESDIISLHVPMTPANYHMINAEVIKLMKPKVMLINVSRGALIDTVALIEALKSEKIAFVGLDVYEEEEHFFFHDLSNKIIKDDQLARLVTFPNVLLTSHQGFLTEEALNKISEVTLQNINTFEQKKPLINQVSAEQFVAPANAVGNSVKAKM